MTEAARAASGPGFVDRVGAAIAAPRTALADADRGVGGAPDVLLLLLLKFVCAEAKAIVAAFWTMIVVGPWDGLGGLLGRLGAAIGADLVFILAGGVIVTIAAGRRRAPGRDFDLAATAWIPALALTALASLIQALTATSWPREVAQGVAAAAIGWMVAMVILAVLTARRRSAS